MDLELCMGRRVREKMRMGPKSGYACERSKLIGHRGQ